MKLSLSQFIKLTEAALTPIKAHVTRVFLNGEEYVALEQKGLNEWTWLKISGRNPERNQPDLFLPNHIIYTLPRFDSKKPFQLPPQVLPKEVKKPNKDQELRVPIELQNPAAAYIKARQDNLIDSGLEYFIKQSAKFSYLYAVCVLHNRFFKGEPVIEQDPFYLRQYKEKFNL